MDSRRIVVALLTARLASAAQNCFWRSNDQINAMGSGWFACNNTQVEEGGAQLCCINGSKCGQDSICLKGVDYYVGGCTDGSYANPVCRTSCSKSLISNLQTSNPGSCADFSLDC